MDSFLVLFIVAVVLFAITGATVEAFFQMVKQVKERIYQNCEGCCFTQMDINCDLHCLKYLIKEKDCPGIIYRIVMSRKRKPTK